MKVKKRYRIELRLGRKVLQVWYRGAGPISSVYIPAQENPSNQVVPVLLQRITEDGVKQPLMKSVMYPSTHYTATFPGGIPV